MLIAHMGSVASEKCVRTRLHHTAEHNLVSNRTCLVVQVCDKLNYALLWLQILSSIMICCGCKS